MAYSISFFDIFYREKNVDYFREGSMRAFNLVSVLYTPWSRWFLRCFVRFVLRLKREPQKWQENRSLRPLIGFSISSPDSKADSGGFSVDSVMNLSIRSLRLAQTNEFQYNNTYPPLNSNTSSLTIQVSSGNW